MLRRHWERVLIATAGAVVLAFSVAACGGGSSSSTSSGGGDVTSAAKTETAAESSSQELSAAKAALAPYTGQPSPFPVTEKLKEVPTGANIAFMDCGDPTCALFWEFYTEAAKAMGVNLTRVKAGSTASTVRSAFDSVIASEPEGVIISAIEPELYKSQLKELQAKDIPVVLSGVTKAEEFGIESVQYGAKQVELVGELMADFTAVEFGPDAQVVYYETPELAFTALMGEALEEELTEVCPECSFRITQIAAAEIGTTAPSTIVSDLQANPETDVALFPAGQMESGLPAALKTAGIDIPTVGSTPTPTNLQYLKEGKETAALGTDLPVLSWTIIDQMAREIIGQKLTGLEAEGLTVLQFLKPEDITFDPSHGWTGYPEFAEKFAELWGVKG